MSAIAEFIRVPIALIGRLDCHYEETVAEHGCSAADYDWSGYVMATLLSYLDEKGVKLMDSPYRALANQLCQERGATFFIFTNQHKDAYLERLSPSLFSVEELRDYFNAFNACDEDEIGQAMFDGITAIQESVRSLDANSVILLCIG